MRFTSQSQNQIGCKLAQLCACLWLLERQNGLAEQSSSGLHGCLSDMEPASLQVFSDGGNEAAAHLVPPEYYCTVCGVRSNTHPQRAVCAARALPLAAPALAQSFCRVRRPPHHLPDDTRMRRDSLNSALVSQAPGFSMVEVLQDLLWMGCLSCHVVDSGLYIPDLMPESAPSRSTQHSQSCC